MISSSLGTIMQALLKDYFYQYLTIQDLGTLKYLLGIEFSYRPGKLVLNNQKYVLDILTEVKLLGCKSRASPIDSKPNFWDSTSPLLVIFMPIDEMCGSLFTWILHILASLIQWISLANLCMCLRRSIGKLLFVFSPISSMLLDVVFSTYNTVIFTWRPTLWL